jgi:hypothetical protein
MVLVLMKISSNFRANVNQKIAAVTLLEQNQDGELTENFQ